MFYGPLMIGMNAYGTTQPIGANCVFHRAALDSIGGHAAGLSEDMHTTMRLYSKGWQSKYIPEVLTRAGALDACGLLQAATQVDLRHVRVAFPRVSKTLQGIHLLAAAALFHGAVIMIENTSAGFISPAECLQWAAGGFFSSPSSTLPKTR